MINLHELPITKLRMMHMLQSQVCARRTQGGFGVKTTLELDILQKIYYLRELSAC